MAVRNIIKRRRDTTPPFDPYSEGSPDYAERHALHKRTTPCGTVMISMGEPIK